MREPIDDDHSSTEHDDSLPFALAPAGTHQPLHVSCTSLSASPISSSACYHGSSELSGGELPALASSVISTPTDSESQSSSFEHGANSSLMGSHLGSHYLDTAASLLETDSSLLGGPSFRLQPKQAVFQAHESPAFEASSSTPEDASVGFSMLMHEADNTRDVSLNRLPVVTEEQSVASSCSLILSSYHLPEASELPPLPSRPRETQDQWFPMNHLFRSTYLQETIVPAAVPQSEERRLASLAGAQASRTGANAFSVSVEIRATSRDVMDIVGNPDLLKLWCDPVQAVVITKSSEGAQNAMNRNSPSAQDGREYEGEWIEASTPELVAPPNTSYVQRASSAIASYLGFPSYGKITMFVERQRGQVGLTIGPFAGDVQVSHNLKVEELPDTQKIRIVDQVKLKRDGEDDPRLCGIWEVIEKCYLPTLDDHMDQVLSSMARLRFLVENGETSVYVDANGGGSASTPLLRL